MEAPPPQSAEQTSIRISLIHPLEDALLHKHLRRLECFLRLLGFCQYSPVSSVLSWLAFAAIGVALPLFLIQYSYCSNCRKYQIRVFEFQVLAAQALIAAVSLLCVSNNLRKHGPRKLLFVDRFSGHTVQFGDLYVRKIRDFFQVVAVWTLLCLLLKVAREITRAIYVRHYPWWQSVGIVIALLVSWTYLTLIFLSGTAMFSLVCNLQVIHFESYGKLLERDLDVSVYIDKHVCLTHYLSKISHRFRIFLLLEFLAVTASLFVALLQTTGNHGILNLINGGDFVISSIIQLVGMILCMHAAVKITNRAQGIASVASRWHAYVTGNPNGASQIGSMTNVGSLEVANPTSVLPMCYSESDLESTDYVPIPTNTQRASYMSSYHKRQAFVTYLQSNPGGFTIFGWAVDRGLINTIFFIELSLFTFVLGKTISFSFSLT